MLTLVILDIELLKRVVVAVEDSDQICDSELTAS